MRSPFFARLLLPALLSSTVAMAANDDWNSQVFYQVMVDRFFNGNKNNDAGTDTRDHLKMQGGDIAGLTQKLDYISQLGATAIILSPINLTSSYHGYHILDHSKIDPRFGSEEEFATFLAQAHKKNLKVIFDLVLNHVSPESSLPIDHPNWFRPSKGTSALNSLVTLELWNTVSFFGLPDFNMQNPEVFDYLMKAAKKWAAMGIDGFRMDAVTLIEPEFWKKFNSTLKEAYPKLFILGEIYSTDKNILDAYTPYFDGYFDFRFYELRNVIGSEQLNLWSYGNEYETQAKKVRFVDNHDVTRIGSDLNSDQISMLTFESLLLAPGIPTLLYGSEFGLRNDSQIEAKHLLFDASRIPMDFKNTNNAQYKKIRSLISIRKKIQSTFKHCEEISGNSMGAFFARFCSDSPKSFANSKFSLLVQNFGKTKISRDFVLHRFLTKDPAELKDLVSGKSINVKNRTFGLQLEPYSSKLLSNIP
jgi:glycosidase